MGYDSRVIICERASFDKNGKQLFCAGFELARIECCGMGDECIDGKYFTDLFDTPIDFDLHNVETSDKEDSGTRVDCYGKHCGYCTVDELIAWLARSECLRDGYRRAKLLLGALLTAKNVESQFDNIVCVHYGH